MQVYFFGKDLFATDVFDDLCEEGGNIFGHNGSEMEQQTERLVHFDDFLEDGMEMLVTESGDQLADFLQMGLFVVIGGDECGF